MKRLWPFYLFVLAASLAFGAATWEPKASASTADPPRDLGGSLWVYVDPITKCEYLRPHGSSVALTPRVAPDGLRQVGCGRRQQELLSLH